MSFPTLTLFKEHFERIHGKRPQPLVDGSFYAYKTGKCVPFTNRLDALHFSDLVEYVEPSHEEKEVRNAQINEYDNRMGTAYIQMIRDEYSYLSNPQFEIIFATAANITGSKLNDDTFKVFNHIIDLVQNPLLGILRRVP